MEKAAARCVPVVEAVHIRRCGGRFVRVVIWRFCAAAWLGPVVNIGAVRAQAGGRAVVSLHCDGVISLN